MKTINKLIIILAIIITSTFTNGQTNGIEYDGEIILPELSITEGIGASAPRDIIHTNDYIYVYTFKRILVYSQSELGTLIFEGEIPFTDNKHGRFAVQYQYPEIYTPDIQLMAHDNANNFLYFVTPNLTVMKVSTDGFNTSLTTVLNTPPQVETGHNSLHGMSKLVYDNDNDRLYWFFRVKESNLHSWGSFFGIYDNDGNWSEIYSEYKTGNLDDDYNELMTTFTYDPSPQSNNFYISRRHFIEFWNIDKYVVPPNEMATQYAEPIEMDQYDNGKMFLVNQGNKNILMAFPYRLYYDDESTTVHSIFQVDVSNPSSYHVEPAPNKRIADAIFLPANDDIMVCYANNHDEHQPYTTTDHDVAVLHFSNGWFYFNQQVLFTNTGDEVDNNVYQNLNRPFKLLKKANGNVLVSKKNDIAEVSHNGSNYTSNTLLYARDNFFAKGVNVNDVPIILNSLHGIEFFGSLGHGHKNTSHPVFNTEYNHISRKLYLFNRLTTNNTCFFIYDLETEQIENTIYVDKPIGDLKFNPAQNQILVSQFTEDLGNGAVILVYDGITGEEEPETINFSGYDYPARMFVSPNGKVFISMNMKYDNKEPKIMILDAMNYSNTLEEISSGLTYDPEDEFMYSVYQSHFVYNSLNSKVYGTISYSYSNYGGFMNPYHNSYNSPYYSKPDPTEYAPEGTTDYPLGKFYSVDNNNTIAFYVDIEMPSEIVCADKENASEPDYQGSVFINCWSATMNQKLYLFDCTDEQYLHKKSFTGELHDIEYSPLTNCVYVYEHEFIGSSNPITDPNESIIHIHKVHTDGTTNKIWEMHGFASSISFNPYDAQLFVYYRAGEKLLGQYVSKVFTLDPFSDDLINTETDDIDLPFRNMTPVIVPIANHPHFDPYNNKAYFPNGMHSSVSVVEFTPKEVLPLYFTGENKKVEWMSVPRMSSNSTTAWNEPDSIETVFDRNNFGTPYYNFLLMHEDASQNGFPNSNEWDEVHDWKHVGDSLVWSYRGYIMDLDTVAEDTNNYLYMYGNVKNPLTEFPLYRQQINWMGYFLPQEQDVFDALGATTLSLINRIEHQEYWCEKRQGTIPYGPTGGTHGQTESWYWMCEKQQTNIKYGEMIKLQSDNDTVSGHELIQWQNPGNFPREKMRPDPEHFSYSETPAYTPIVIELDYTSNPDEIGAFVNDTCRGATTVLSEDSVVYMRAYLDGLNSDSLAFQDYTKTKSSGKNNTKEYRVYNKHTGIYEKRAIIRNPGNNIVRISFRKDAVKEDEEKDIASNIGIWPNPAANILNYSFEVGVETKYSIRFLDISGRQVGETEKGKTINGYNSGMLQLIDSSGMRLKPGIYFVSFEIGNAINIKKLVIN